MDPDHDAIVTMDDSGLIIGWNRRASEIFGWTLEEVHGQAVADVLASHTSTGNPVQFPVNERNQPREGLLLASPPLQEQSGDSYALLSDAPS